MFLTNLPVSEVKWKKRRLEVNLNLMPASLWWDVGRDAKEWHQPNNSIVFNLGISSSNIKKNYLEMFIILFFKVKYSLKHGYKIWIGDASGTMCVYSILKSRHSANSTFINW